MRPIRIALTKGRLEKMSVQLFTKMGLDCTALIEKGRRPVSYTHLTLPTIA